ncbi:MAG: preprotein translocase subunit SecA [Candidatus Latescibacterota bacterium]
MLKLLQKVFGSQSEREYRRALPRIQEILRHAEEAATLPDAELRARTDRFRGLIAERTRQQRDRLDELEGLLRGDLEPSERERLNDEYADLDTQIRAAEAATLDEIMAEAFGLVRETCRRLLGRTWERTGDTITWDMVPYDVQLFGAMVLHQGKIAEMATGEGKTLVATMPLYLNALTGRGVHLVTHNNYLARRDAMWMGPIYTFLGLSVGVIQDARQTGGAEAYLLARPEGVPQEFTWRPATRQEAYAADVLYGTKDQVGFDYLYDNMETRPEDLRQREFNYAIVDEADSNLIDDARTPLIISGPVPESTNRYGELRPLVQKLMRAQTNLVAQIVADAEKGLGEEGVDQYEIGMELLRATRGMPKNRRLLRVLQEEGVKRLIGRVEADYMRDKRLSEIDEGLYFVVDERAHTIDLTEKGRDLLSPDEQAMFILPDVGEEVEQIRSDGTLTPEEKTLKEEEAHREHAAKSEVVHSINQLMRAYTLFEKDVQYMVTDDKHVVIVDESTGRPQPGRRFADGLHQALEAKEGVKIEQETQTVATITLQNLFRMYHRLAGMTGTAETEAGELWEIYKLDVAVIPTNRPVRRLDQDDQIFRTRKEKFDAIIDEIERLHQLNLPVLVGTISVEVSELLSRMLTRRGIQHQLLNARYHEKEAQIVAQAGQPGAVTIATNMAGRGTDIKLAPEVVHLDRAVVESSLRLNDKLPSGQSLRQYLMEHPSGLQVIGTERHEARRIDRQLRGRSGRQGDPGSSRFFLSLEDDLMRLFGSERIAAVMDRLGAQEGEVIEHPMVTRSIGRAQRKVEARNFEMRKHLLEYDDVMNQQRQVIYSRRHELLGRHTAHEQVLEMVEQTIDNLVTTYAVPAEYPQEWDWEGLQNEFGNTFFLAFHTGAQERAGLTVERLRERLHQAVRDSYDRRVQMVGPEVFHQVEKAILLHTVDSCWQEHLYAMDELKDSVNFAGVGGKNPLIEYKKGAYETFERLIARIDQEGLRRLFQLRIDVAPQAERRPQPAGRFSPVHREATNLGFRGTGEPAAPGTPGAPAAPRAQVSGDGLPLGTPARADRRLVASGGSPEADAGPRQPVRAAPKVGRNEPCPCGSGKKYKLCHGRAG